MSLQPSQKTTTFVEQEGRSQMEACIAAAFSYAKENRIESVVMFTGSGEGPLFAAQTYLANPDYKTVRLVAVTPPHKKPYRSDPLVKNSPVFYSGITPPMRHVLESAGVEICSGQLLFKPLRIGSKLESEWARVEAALSIMGGGLALCVQATILACDAGVLHPRSRVVTLTADTAIDAYAARTEDFLSDSDGLIINHIVCRPSKFTISKSKHRLYIAESPQLAQPVSLPSDAASQEPTAASQEPAVASQEPAVASQEPAVASQEPAVASQEPAAASQGATIASPQETAASSQQKAADEGLPKAE